MFYIGQKVVCINATPIPFGTSMWWKGKTWISSGEMDGLTEGKIYTVRGFFKETASPSSPENKLGIYLEEIHRQIHHEGEVPFRSTRFRPLVEAKTSEGYSILQKILDDATEKEKV